LSRDLGLVPADDHLRLEESATEVKRMLAAFVAYARRDAPNGRRIREDDLATAYLTPDT
jgi:hypothetical protein